MNAIRLPNNNTAIAIKSSSILDFEESRVQVLDLDTLKRTHKENDIYGNPLKELYHYELIERIGEICENSGLKYEIEEIFAAQNKTKQMPGVVLLPQIEAVFGEKAAEAHILRRVFTTIRIDDDEDEETNTCLALAYHQDGVQVAIGPNVKICHNQCILCADRIISNYGSDKVSTKEIFKTVNRWLGNFFQDRETDKRIIEQMKRINMNLNDLYTFIGLLNALRVMHDSKDREISSKVKQYPLNQAQISMFTDKLITYLVKKGCQQLTLWEVYNFATEIYKPESAEIPNIMNQNLSLIETICEYYEIN